MRALDVATKFENLLAKQWPAFEEGKTAQTTKTLEETLLFGCRFGKSGV